MKADLHVHSTASDGTLSPSALVERALERDVDVLAIADHDSVEGLAEAGSAASGSRLTLVPAVELSSTLGPHDIHILGYFIRTEDPRLLELLGDLRAARLRRAERMVDALKTAGYRIALEDVLSHAEDGAVGRSHVARALVDAGYAEQTGAAFAQLIGRGRPFYVAKEAHSPSEAIDTITDAGGLAVVAHPGVNRIDEVIPDLVSAGLRGIEAFHADHTPAQRLHYTEIARDLGLLVTGGTDFHGPDAPNPDIGEIEIPAECVQRFLEAGASR